MRTSPWIILGSTIILLIVVIVFAIQNSNRERRYMAELLSAKGTALIRAVEAGARTGMTAMMWGGNEIQRLLEETSRLPDVLYMAVVDDKGIIVAHSDPSKIGTRFRESGKPIHLDPNLKESWEMVSLDKNRQVFEVYRHFRPLWSDDDARSRHMRGMMRGHGMMAGTSPNDWFAPGKGGKLLIVAGLDPAPFEAAMQEDARITMVMSAILLLAGFGGFVSLFWMYSYRSTRRTLQDTSAFAEKLVTHLPVGLIATDQQERITFFNAAAETITGLSAVDARGSTLDGLLPVQLHDLKKMLARGNVVTEKENDCTFPHGRTVPLSISAARIVNERGEFVGLVLILRDLREVRRLEAEIRRQEKLAALGGLAAGVAHEIRNPLSSIKGLASFFASQFPEGSEAKTATGVMIQEVERLNRAVSELLDFARPTDIKCRPTDIGPLLSRSIQLVQQDAANREIRIELDIADDICPASIDPDRISQCLLNIYLNAIQAMGSGGVLRVECRNQGKQALVIGIRDTGAGIARADLPKIFDPYFTTKGNGTGLGLAIVHKIVEAHRGHVRVDSQSGKGTRVTVQIPCDPDAACVLEDE